MTLPFFSGTQPSLTVFVFCLAKKYHAHNAPPPACPPPDFVNTAKHIRVTFTPHRTAETPGHKDRSRAGLRRAGGGGGGFEAPASRNG